MSTVPKIRVVVRKRPLSRKEEQRGETDIVVVECAQTVVVREQKMKVDLTPYVDDYRFNFDSAYSQHTTNSQLYVSSVQPLVYCAFDGARVSCFAYGQTGSGKTYTMLGDALQVQGLYLLAAHDIFLLLHESPLPLTVTVSFYEIYCGKLYDLLNERSLLFAREDAHGEVNIIGLSERPIHSVEQLVDFIQFGSNIRVTAQNGTNVDSSRSHAILQILLKNGNEVHGKISFIDLAGSERAADHANQLQKQTRIDGAQINKSLLALKECIRALDQGKNHTPFRGSKLTMVLRDSFTGYCRTLMIGNISPNSASCENTLNTLKYADRVKELKKPRKENLQAFDQLSREMMMPRHIVPQMRLSQDNVRSSNSHQQKPKLNNFLIAKQPAPVVSNNKSIHFTPKHFEKPTFKASPTRERATSANCDNISSSKRHPKPIVLSFEQLTNQHETMIDKVVMEEEQLLKAHENHINHTIDMIKKQTVLLNAVDKAQSDMESYLNHLEQVLYQEVSSITLLQQRIKDLHKHTKELKVIEKQYILRSEGHPQNHYQIDHIQEERKLFD